MVWCEFRLIKIWRTQRHRCVSTVLQTVDVHNDIGMRYTNLHTILSRSQPYSNYYSLQYTTHHPRPTVHYIHSDILPPTLVEYAFGDLLHRRVDVADDRHAVDDSLADAPGEPAD